MNRQWVKPFSPIFSFCRSKVTYPGDNGIKYPGGITYYPKSPDYVEPKITPAKLFRVERIKPMKHTLWRLKNILREFKIDGDNKVTVVKNIPEVNGRLWKVKHLVKITPITFPYGEPKEGDISYTKLLENGQCIVTQKLQPDTKQIEAREQYDANPKKMNSDTIKRDSRHKWNSAYNGGF